MSIQNASKGQVSIDGKPVAEIDSWEISTPDSDSPTWIPAESYSYVGTFKTSWWQRLKMRRSMRKFSPKSGRLVTLTFNGAGVIGRATVSRYKPVWAKDVHRSIS